MSTEAIAPRADDRLSLFDLARNLVDLMALREEALSDEERAVVEGEIRRYVEAEVRKVDGIRAYLRHCEVMEAAAKEEAERQDARKRAWSARYERLKQICLDVMQAFGEKKLEGKTGTLAVVGNGGLKPIAPIQEDLIPDEYKTFTLRLTADQLCAVARVLGPALPKAEEAVSTAAVREALERGEIVPGAHLDERGVHLRVK